MPPQTRRCRGRSGAEALAGWRQLDASVDGAVCGGGLTRPVRAASIGRLCRRVVSVVTGPSGRRPRRVRGRSAATDTSIDEAVCGGDDGTGAGDVLGGVGDGVVSDGGVM